MIFWPHECLNEYQRARIKAARNADYQNNVYNYCSGLRGDIYYAWIGDPTLTFNDIKK